MSPRFAAIAASLLLVIPAVRAELPLTLSVSATTARNFSRTSYLSDQRDATSWEAIAATTFHRQVARNLQASVDAAVSAMEVSRYSGMNRWRAEATAALRRKFGLGPLAPALRAHCGIAFADFREKGRTATEITAGVELAKRFTDTLQASVGAEWLEADARHRPFDVRNHRISADASWDLSERWRLGLGGGRTWGEVTANANPVRWSGATGGALGTGIASYYNSLAWEVSDTFGQNWVAYKIDGHGDFWSAMLSPALGDATSIPLRYEHVRWVNGAGIAYVSAFWSVSIVHRF